MIQMKINIKDNITPLLRKQRKQLDQLPKKAYKVFKDNTAVRSGNARRNTSIQGQTIKANYPYAQRLNEGWSKQTPEGMTKPTEEFISQEFIKIMTGK